MRRPALLVLVAALSLLVAAGCVPPDPGPSGLYLGIQPGISPVVTPKDQPVVWGHAPAIDAHYGGTLYQGSPKQGQDPRPALVNGNEPLRLWAADPHDGRTNRPAIIWIHGGGFAYGIDSMYGLGNTVAKAYAQRGYVGFSIEYRIDTTQVQLPNGSWTSLCQWVQDDVDPSSQLWQDRKAQCERNILDAQYDALGAVRWVRAHAAFLGVDPNRIAVGGFSAGAVTSSMVAYQHDQIGPVSYFPGDPRTADASYAQATFGASGCTYSPDLGVPTTIGAGDSPTSFIQSEQDQAVPYACAANTTEAARAQGLVAELTSYCGQGGHAQSLYDQNKAATDEQWTTFLARQLNLYSGMRPPSADPVCAGY